MKISIVYHSQSENTKKLAEIISKGVQLSGNIEVKVMSIDKINEKFINDSKAVIFGSPTYSGSLSWQMKKWFDTTSVQLEGKIGGVFATENYIGGGADNAELSMIGCILIRGMLAYSGGFTKGDPMTHFGAVAIKDGDESQRERALLFGKRIAEKAVELFK
jgi:NAD(P)H dehydrogenase (quinone)